MASCVPLNVLDWLLTAISVLYVLHGTAMSHVSSYKVQMAAGMAGPVGNPIGKPSQHCCSADSLIVIKQAIPVVSSRQYHLLHLLAAQTVPEALTCVHCRS